MNGEQDFEIENTRRLELEIAELRGRLSNTPTTRDNLVHLSGFAVAIAGVIVSFFAIIQSNRDDAIKAAIRIELLEQQLELNREFVAALTEMKAGASSKLRDID